jgi:8-oxo-dGTP pyrophosphatase MutT (NUDIX family)
LLLGGVVSIITKWKKLSSCTLIRDKWIHLTSNEFFNEDVVIAPYYLLYYPDWVIIIAVTFDQQLLLVKQFRAGTNAIELELPAGTIDKEDQSPIDAAIRELAEETGYIGDGAEIIGKMTVDSTTHCNYCHVVFIKNVRKAGLQHLDQTEWIELCTVPVSEIKELIIAGKIRLGPHIGALYQARLKYPELF